MAAIGTTDATTSGDRFFLITNDDHRGSILTVSIITATYLPLLLALRVWLSSRSLELDDHLFVAATVGQMRRFWIDHADLCKISGFVQSILIWVSVSKGLGKSYSHVNRSDADEIGSVRTP
jgi:hypothetical protein